MGKLGSTKKVVEEREKCGSPNEKSRRLLDFDLSDGAPTFEKYRLARDGIVLYAAEFAPVGVVE